MTTKLTGGRITGLLALTLEAQAALEVGDPVHVTGNYECNKADGTKPVVGHVSVANKKRVGGTYPSNEVPGDVTVEARGFEVRTGTAGAAVAAGVAVKYDATNRLVTWVVGTDSAEKIAGISLQAAGAAAAKFDFLVN